MKYFGGEISRLSAVYGDDKIKAKAHKTKPLSAWIALGLKGQRNSLKTKLSGDSKRSSGHTFAN